MKSKHRNLYQNLKNISILAKMKSIKLNQDLLVESQSLLDNSILILKREFKLTIRLETNLMVKCLLPNYHHGSQTAAFQSEKCTTMWRKLNHQSIRQLQTNLLMNCFGVSFISSGVLSMDQMFCLNMELKIVILMNGILI